MFVEGIGNFDIVGFRLWYDGVVYYRYVILFEYGMEVFWL